MIAYTYWTDESIRYIEDMEHVNGGYLAAGKLDFLIVDVHFTKNSY